jgi:hypothetical protein
MAALSDRVPLLSNPRGVRFEPVDVTRPSGAHMKGFPLLHLLELMDQQGPGVATAWREALPPAARAQAERKNVTSVAWLPVELYFHGVEWLARSRFGGPRGGLEAGHFTATQDIGAFFRVAMAFTSPPLVLGVSGRFWKSYFDKSSLHVLASTPTSCTAEVRDWPLRDETSLHEVTGSLVAWMEASRAKDVHIERMELVSRGTLAIDCSWR